MPIICSSGASIQFRFCQEYASILYFRTCLNIKRPQILNSPISILSWPGTSMPRLFCFWFSFTKIQFSTTDNFVIFFWESHSRPPQPPILKLFSWSRHFLLWEQFTALYGLLLVCSGWCGLVWHTRVSIERSAALARRLRDYSDKLFQRSRGRTPVSIPDRPRKHF